MASNSMHWLDQSPSSISDNTLITASFLSDLLDAIFGDNSGKGSNKEPKWEIVDIQYIPGAYDWGELGKMGNACCQEDPAGTDANGDGEVDCMLKETSGFNPNCGGTVSTITAEFEDPPGSGQLVTECRQVKNKRGDGKTAIATFRTKTEWLAFTSKYDLPRGVTSNDLPLEATDCFCGRRLTVAELYEGIGYNLTDMFPGGPDRPPPSSEQATLDKLCLDLGCGAVAWIAVRTYNSPDNNTIVFWRDDMWKRLPASTRNEKLNGCGGTAGAVIECSLPGSPPPGSYPKVNCD